MTPRYFTTVAKETTVKFLKVWTTSFYSMILTDKDDQKLRASVLNHEPLEILEISPVPHLLWAVLLAT